MILGLPPMLEDQAGEVPATKGLSIIVGEAFDRRDRVVVVDLLGGSVRALSGPRSW